MRRDFHAQASSAPRGRNGFRGFTLIELVITVAVVALLATLAFPLAEVAVQRSKEQELRAALRDIRGAIDAYKQAVDEGKVKQPSVEKTRYPPSLKVLVAGETDITSPNKDAKIYFLRRLPRDPMASDPTLPPEDTWGKRSYASPPDDPQEGEDVYDVYSRSERVGLNGIPYKQW
jgi:general secretion pathway protein G